MAASHVGEVLLQPHNASRSCMFSSEQRALHARVVQLHSLCSPMHIDGRQHTLYFMFSGLRPRCCCKRILTTSKGVTMTSASVMPAAKPAASRLVSVKCPICMSAMHYLICNMFFTDSHRAQSCTVSSLFSLLGKKWTGSNHPLQAAIVIKSYC